MNRLVVVTATVDPEKTRAYWQSWREKSRGSYHTIVVLQGGNAGPLVKMDPVSMIFSPTLLGTVPAFAVGVAAAVVHGAEVIACFHDDLRIDKEGWDLELMQHFDRNPLCGLAGFSGADGLGAADIYQTAYEPHQLARQGFFSNMQEAEKHGRREPYRRRSACCDGFSLIGRRRFFEVAWPSIAGTGILHHAYDSWMGALAKRWGWETWYLPIACHHAGGMTAVGSVAYQEWAAERGGDQVLWEAAHRKMYDDCREVLPFRVEEVDRG